MPADRELDQILNTALVRHEAGQIDLAEAGYRTVLEHDPNEPDALNLLGVILQERGELAKSIALITRALDIDPDFPEALTNLARAQRAAGEPAAAVEASRRAIALDPDLTEAHVQLGRALVDQGENADAVAALRQATILAPDSVDALVQLGIALIRQMDFHAGADSLTAALALDPDRVDAMIPLGVALASLDRLDEAADWHEKAAARAPEDPAAHAALAITAGRRLDPVGSIAACRRSLELAPNQVDIWQLLGGNLAAVARFAEAEECWRKTLALKPDSAAAQRGLAAIGRPTEDATEVQRLRGALDDEATPLAERVAAGFAAGAVLDRNGDFDAAFAAFEGANHLLHTSQSEAGQMFNRGMLRHYVDWAIATFSKDGFAETADWGDPSELPVFIVGMPRSGTSLVEQIAASHRKIFGQGERKDIGDIIRVLDGGATHRPPAEWARDAVRRAASAQVARLQAVGGHADRVIDKLPDNSLVLGQIAVLFPNARIIVCRRDPRDVCLSCYFQHFADRLSWTSDQIDLAVRAREIERLMEHWRAVLPLRMIEIDYETLVADLEGESRRLVAFLGLEWDPNCLAFDTTRRSVTTASYWQVRQPVYASSVGRWRNYSRHLRPLFAGLSGLISSEGDEDWDALAADPVTALAIGVAHLQVRRLEFAEPIYRALLRRAPADPSALHLLGLLLVDRGEPAEAIPLLARSLAVRPNVAPVLADLARAHRAAGDVEAAVEAARRAAVLDPGLPDAHLQLGYALLLRQDDTGAIEAMRRATATDSKFLEAWIGLATALSRRNDHGAAAATWQTAVKLKPDEPGLLIEYAGSLFELKRFGEALATYRKVEALVAGHSGAQYGTARTLALMGDASASADVCRRALKSAPERSELWLLLANCEVILGHFDVAADAYRRTLSLKPRLPDALNGLSIVGDRLEGQATKDGALALLNDPLVPVRDRIQAGFVAGRVSDTNGAYDDAFAAYALANRMLRADRAARGVVFDREAYRFLVDQLIAMIGPRTFAETAGWGDPSEVPVFVVGMPRSGTSLVEQIAASHPLVFGAGEKAGFFDILAALDGPRVASPVTSWDRTAMRRETTAYLGRLRARGGDAARFIDKMPDNLLFLGHIAVLFPRRSHRGLPARSA